MNDRLFVSLNGEVKLEYDRSKPLAPDQFQYLENMDLKMEQGFKYNGEFYTLPDQTRRAQFVTVNLVQALLAENEQTMAAMCSYLAVRLPDLKQVQATTHGDSFTVDLIFDQVLEPDNNAAANDQAGSKSQSGSQTKINVTFNPNIH